ncbi:hypothetical protein BC828DRAFT_373898 [Blastocladiella britannica]|nr:hypothetical protein BC828DRAFT_373898 [Blastocladiella britannica]
MNHYTDELSEMSDMAALADAQSIVMHASRLLGIKDLAGMQQQQLDQDGGGSDLPPFAFRELLDHHHQRTAAAEPRPDNLTVLQHLSAPAEHYAYPDEAALRGDREELCNQFLPEVQMYHLQAATELGIIESILDDGLPAWPETSDIQLKGIFLFFVLGEELVQVEAEQAMLEKSAQDLETEVVDLALDVDQKSRSVAAHTLALADLLSRYPSNPTSVPTPHYAGAEDLLSTLAAMEATVSELDSQLETATAAGARSAAQLGRATADRDAAATRAAGLAREAQLAAADATAAQEAAGARDPRIGRAIQTRSKAVESLLRATGIALVGAPAAAASGGGGAASPVSMAAAAAVQGGAGEVVEVVLQPPATAAFGAPAPVMAIAEASDGAVSIAVTVDAVAGSDGGAPLTRPRVAVVSLPASAVSRIGGGSSSPSSGSVAMDAQNGSLPITATTTSLSATAVDNAPTAARLDAAAAATRPHRVIAWAAGTHAREAVVQALEKLGYAVAVRLAPVPIRGAPVPTEPGIVELAVSRPGVADTTTALLIAVDERAWDGKGRVLRVAQVAHVPPLDPSAEIQAIVRVDGAVGWPIARIPDLVPE